MVVTNPQKLILVYNADAGWTAAVKDAVQKVMHPESYECSLCMISYGSVSMQRAWRDFLDRLPMEKQFYHRQDFARGYPLEAFPMLADMELPAILVEDDGGLEVLLDKKRLDIVESIDGLIAATELALANR